jgi:hypothetical protein
MFFDAERANNSLILTRSFDILHDSYYVLLGIKDISPIISRCRICDGWLGITILDNLAILECVMQIRLTIKLADPMTTVNAKLSFQKVSVIAFSGYECTMQ